MKNSRPSQLILGEIKLAALRRWSADLMVLISAQKLYSLCTWLLLLQPSAYVVKLNRVLIRTGFSEVPQD
jgi:hypothetical protein